MTDLSAFSLAGKRIVVTGANTGIGQGICVAIAKAGGAVIGVGRSSMDETEALVKAEGGAFAPVACDLGDHAAASTMLEGVWETAGQVDGLVNNAGIIRRADAVDFYRDRLGRRDGRQFEVAVLPLPGLRQKSARRRNGREGSSTSPRCSPSRAASALPPTRPRSMACWASHELLACEWAAKGINVNAIAPGYIVSNNTEALRNDPDRSACHPRPHPGGALGQAGGHRRRGRVPARTRIRLHAWRGRAGGWRLAGQIGVLHVTDTTLFSQPDAKPWTPTPDGNRRRVILHTDELMMVEFGFEKGGVGALHSHPHVQSSYVAEGRFEVTIDGKTEIVEEGGAFIVPSGLVHGVKALEAGRLVDTFTPHRADFL